MGETIQVLLVEDFRGWIEILRLETDWPSEGNTQCSNWRIISMVLQSGYKHVRHCLHEEDQCNKSQFRQKGS